MRKLPAVLALIGAISIAETTGDSPELVRPEREDTCAPTPEHCNDADDDCDGYVDEDPIDTFYADDDRDGYGDPEDGRRECDLPDGFVDNGADCDDDDPDINPDAEEIAGNDVDEDCDRVIESSCGENPPQIAELEVTFDPAYPFGGSDEPAAVVVATVTDVDGDLTEVVVLSWVEADGDGAVDTSSQDTVDDVWTLRSDDELCSVRSVELDSALSLADYAEDTDVVDIALAVQDEAGHWSEPAVVTVPLD